MSVVAPRQVLALEGESKRTLKIRSFPATQRIPDFLLIDDESAEVIEFARTHSASGRSLTASPANNALDQPMLRLERAVDRQARKRQTAEMLAEMERKRRQKVRADENKQREWEKRVETNPDIAVAAARAWLFRVYVLLHRWTPAGQVARALATRWPREGVTTFGSHGHFGLPDLPFGSELLTQGLVALERADFIYWTGDQDGWEYCSPEAA